jgi:carbon starvation protein CstA
LSGFHATQTPIISRTTQREGQGRKIFYGMMIAEGIIAMVWAAAAMSLFHGSTGLNELLATGGTGLVVSEVAKVTLGAVVGTFAVLGVIVLPITSGDTAFRSARMIIADYIKLPQLSMKSRLLIAVPLFVISIALTQIDFNILWRYFSWANQATGVIALFVGAMYLYIARKNFWVALIPGAMMLYTTTVYILNAQIGFRLSMNASYIVGAVISAVLVIIFFKAAQKARAAKLPLDVDVSGFNKAA